MSAEPHASPEETWEPPEAMPGYRLVARIGRGGMGKVYLAREVQLDRLVALKFLSAPAWATTAPDRFLAEARALARLDHPNIVGVYRIEECEGHPFIAYEYVKGESLERMLKPVRWQTALALATRVASALGAAHHAGLLHRDIKPGNVMISPSGKVKLLDFGLAIDAATTQARVVPRRSAEAQGRVSVASGLRLTEPGLAVGTPRYWAPEQWQGLPATRATDVYSFGLLVHELLTGELPHAGLAGAELSHAIATEDVPPIELDLAPKPLIDVVARCLRRDPRERYQTAVELAEALEDVEAVFLHRTRVETAVVADADVVMASWSRVAGSSDALAQRAYAILFDRHPELRHLFPADLRAQREKLVHALELAIQSLRAPARVAPLLRELGRRHVAYGVQPSMLHAFGRALRVALGESDPRWSAEVDTAWEHAYGFIAASMRAGMRPTSEVISAPGSAREKSGPRTIDPPRAACARVDGGMVDYLVAGRGPPDVVLLPSLLDRGESTWTLAGPARLVTGLARFARVIAVDRRAGDASDAGDVLAVTSAEASTRAVVVAAGEAAAVGAHLAAARPGLMEALVVVGDAAPDERDALDRIEVPKLVIEPRDFAGDLDGLAREIERCVAGLGATALASVTPRPASPRG
jgi:eukaryotic-like serine/threonine-protein kinase